MEPVPAGIWAQCLDRWLTCRRPAETCAALEADRDHRRVITWLLRKQFERYLKRFEDDGLMLEEVRKEISRLLHGRDGKPRKLVYDTDLRKGVRIEVVKQRAEGPRSWFENEGFGYEVILLDVAWGVRIKPFYMFTGRDAKKPLPSFARTSRATRRMKVERDNVDDSLTFWGRFLSVNGATINIGQDHVDDLILEGEFMTIEVAEQGLIRDTMKVKIECLLEPKLRLAEDVRASNRDK